MVKRSRDNESALRAPQRVKRENSTQLPQPNHFREPSMGGKTMGKARGQLVEKGRAELEANRVAGNSLSPPVVAGDSLKARLWDVGSAVAELPRWWQLWLGRGEGMVVNYEELLWGWFPFVDEDFSVGAEKLGWFPTGGDDAEGTQEDVPYDDIWQLKHINEIPNHSR